MGLPFLNPWLLLATAGVAVPIVIHLLNRHRFKTYEWAAMELLRKVVRVRSRQLRLEDLLLLVLRCLAVLLVALAVARPTTKWSGAAKSANVGLVVALDVSYSMAQKPGVYARFDRALDRVHEILSSVEPGNPVTLVLLGNHPRVILRNVAYDANRFNLALRDLAPLPEGLSVDNCLPDLVPLMRELEAPERELYLVTDGQAATWASLAEKDKLRLAELGRLGRVFFVASETENDANVAITRFELTSGALRKGELVLFTAQVRNFGSGEQAGLDVSLLADGLAVDRQFISRLAPEQSVAVPLYAAMTKDGVVRLNAALGGDALSIDNVRNAVVYVRKTTRVLCVDGGSDVPGTGATDFLVTALAPRGPAQGEGALEVKAIPWLALPAIRPSDYDVVILANVADVSEEKAAALYDFVAQGGGLMVFLGANTSPDVLNKRLRRGTAPLLPAQLVSVFPDARERSDGELMDTTIPDHPLVGALNSLRPGLLSDNRFYRWMKVEVSPHGTPLLKLAGTGDPILLEGPVGRGKVLLFTSSADRSWCNLVVNPAYAILVQQAVTYLGRLPYERPLTVSQPLLLPLAGLGRADAASTPQADAAPPSVTVTDPKGKISTLAPVWRDGQALVEMPETEWNGFYEVQAGAEAPAVAVAVNVDPAESDVKVLHGEDLAAVLTGTAVSVLAPGQDVASAVRDSRVGHELWRYFVVAALGVLLLEALAARRFWRRSRAVDSVMRPPETAGRPDVSR
jgi:hypothetical protein